MNAAMFSDAMNEISEKYITEVLNFKKRNKKSYLVSLGVIAACLAIIVLFGIRMNHTDNYIALNYNQIKSVGYAGVSSTSIFRAEQATMEDINMWIGIDLCSNLPEELENYTLKHYLIKNIQTNDIHGIIIWGELEEAEYPIPLFCIQITTEDLLQEFHFEYDFTTSIDGIAVAAAVKPSEERINQNGETIYTPEQYYSLFDIDEYHCSVRTEGQVSEDAFSELNNILINCLLEN